MDGILPLFKPKGMTSHDCVYKIRKLLQTKKVGHTGTLDPDVTGVLPICIGKATKVVEYLTESSKAYAGEVTLGAATTTEDASGDIIESKPIERIEKERILHVLATFVGEIKQTPPMYSAVKVNGKRLYEYARNGIEVERPSRTVMIYDLEYTDSKTFIDNDQPSFTFSVKCSKGTYIRTLAVDIGRKLGFPSHMSNLTRTKSGNFTIEQCLTFEEIERKIADGCLRLSPIESALSYMPKKVISKELVENVQNGAVFPIIDILKENQRILFVSPEGKSLAIYQQHPTKKHLMKPEKVF